MEEQIKKVIDQTVQVGLEGEYPYKVVLTYTSAAAKEIAKDMVLFIDWLWSEDCPFVPGDECWTEAANPGMARYTLTELYPIFKKSAG